MKLFILSEDLKIKNKWICDVFYEEFVSHCNNYSNIEIVDSPKKADTIWLLASWYYKKIDINLLMAKNVITTIHHIDNTKYIENKKMYDTLDKFTNVYHVICNKVYNDLSSITNKSIILSNFWINEKIFYHLDNKSELRSKYSIPSDHLIIGSFQRDTEGKDENLPKLSKGPDIFINIVNDMKNNNKNPFVVLTGWRRTYIIHELEKLNIPYIYHELVDQSSLNELYNCLDLYIVSSRVEGGPRALMECGLCKTPIISTDVGISDVILDKTNIYDMNDFITYKNAIPNIDIAYSNSLKYSINNYMKKFINNLF